MQQYTSSVSAYQAAPGEDGTPGDRGTPTEPSHRGVNNKVSAWLQQTDDTDTTSQGQNLSAPLGSGSPVQLGSSLYSLTFYWIGLTGLVLGSIGRPGS